MTTRRRRQPAKPSKRDLLKTGVQVIYGRTRKVGVVQDVLSTQFTVIPDGRLWPEFVMFDDPWEILEHDHNSI